MKNTVKIIKSSKSWNNFGLQPFPHNVCSSVSWSWPKRVVLSRTMSTGAFLLILHSFCIPVCKMLFLLGKKSSIDEINECFLSLYFGFVWVVWYLFMHMLFLSTGLLFGLNGLNKKVEKIQESANKIGNQLNDSLLTLRVLPNSKWNLYWHALYYKTL